MWKRFRACFSSSASRQHSKVPREADNSQSSFSVNFNLGAAETIRLKKLLQSEDEEKITQQMLQMSKQMSYCGDFRGRATSLSDKKHAGDEWKAMRVLSVVLKSRPALSEARLSRTDPDLQLVRECPSVTAASGYTRWSEKARCTMHAILYLQRFFFAWGRHRVRNIIIHF